MTPTFYHPIQWNKICIKYKATTTLPIYFRLEFISVVINPTFSGLTIGTDECPEPIRAARSVIFIWLPF